MSRQSADKLRPDQTRQAIWDIIRADKIVSANDLRKQIGLGLDTVRDYLHGLTAAGYLMRYMPATTWLYELIKDNGQEAPRVRKDGSAVTQGLAREKMWCAMGIFAQKGKAFTAHDLTFGSTIEIPIALVDAKNYCHHLHHGGYLTIVQPGSPGKMEILTIESRL